VIKYFGVITLLCLYACSPSRSNAYFCEAQQSRQFDGFIRHYIVQLSPDRLCVSWETGVMHCGLFNKETTTPWTVNNATGTKAQLSYQASMADDLADLTITRHEVLLLSQSNEGFNRSAEMGFKFSKKNMVLTASRDKTDADLLTYACSTWQKKPWWEWS
jgi:hypothetical protein